MVGEHPIHVVAQIPAMGKIETPWPTELRIRDQVSARCGQPAVFARGERCRCLAHVLDEMLSDLVEPDGRRPTKSPDARPAEHGTQSESTRPEPIMPRRRPRLGHEPPRTAAGEAAL